jgi:hypothetical protein
MEKDKKIILVIITSLIIVFILFYFINNRKYNYKKLLENNNYDIVYNRVATGTDKVPYINIKNEQITKINQEIDDLYQEYLLFSPDGFHYEYNVSGKILSLIITAYIVHPESTHYDIIYRSYNYDLKEGKLLTDQDILKQFDIPENKMEYFLYNKFLNYYNSLIANGYFTEEQCDFNCFLENKNVENLLDDNYYYINNNHLELYKYFNIFTDYNEENYFKEKDFHFIVT